MQIRQRGKKPTRQTHRPRDDTEQKRNRWAKDSKKHTNKQTNIDKSCSSNHHWNEYHCE